jgi:perosamine synthetase
MMKKPLNIPVFRPYVGDEEIQAVTEVLKSRWIGLGPKTAEFEKAFAKFVGTEYAVGLNSGTAALAMALKLLHINRGDEVIVPTITFVSTAHAVEYNLATPIFADVDPATLNIDVSDVKKKITKRTKAIIVVHYSGRPVAYNSLKKLASEYHLHLIEDAAHAAGASYMGLKCGSLGKIAAFSFHAVKPLVMGEGGALTLNDFSLAQRAKKLRWLGIDKGTWDRTDKNQAYWWEYQVEEIGQKCHLDDIHAAIGLVQLKNIDRIQQLRLDRANYYTKLLEDVKEVTTPLSDDATHTSSWHLYCIKCPNRDKLSVFLKKHGISTSVHYKPIHMYPCYGNRAVLPVAEEVFKKILTLPLYPELGFDDIEFIVEKMKEFYAKNR